MSLANTIFSPNYSFEDDNILLHPFTELFLWAVICNMQEMALCFWSRGDDTLAKALTAVKIYSKMADVYKSEHYEVQEEIYEKLLKNAE